jgi:outer membrane usher protein
LAEEVPYSLQLYAIKVNGQDMGTGQILNSKSDGYLATAEDLENWGLKQANSVPIKFKNEGYYPLRDFKGFKFKYDEANQELSLEFDPIAFRPTIVATQFDNIIPSKPETGGYFNYDLFGTGSNSPFSNQTQLNGQFETGMFNSLGAGFSSFSGQNLYASSPGGNTATRLIRLETNWIRDFPEKKQSLTFGDATGRGGVWGRPVKFGGFQFGTNFATQPNFITFPLPTFSGAAALPSTTEIFINGLKQSSQTLTPGPFQLNNIPFITGAGEATMVVKDMLGRQQVITQPFYATPSLLRPGTADYTMEMGFIRNNLGIDNANYGQPMAVWTQRKGFSDKLTTEWRGEVLPNQQTAGIAVTYIPPIPVALTAATALSSSANGRGDFLLLGLDRQSLNELNFGLHSQFTSNSFMQLGSIMPGQARQYSATMGLPTKTGSFAVGYIYLKNANPPRTEAITASYSRMLGRNVSVSATATTSLSAPANPMLNVFLAFPLDDGIFVSSNFTQQQGKTSGSVMMQKNFPIGIGPQWGYRSQVGGGQGQNEAAGVTLKTDYGIYMLDAGRTPGQTSYTMSASGSAEYLDGKMFLSDRSYDSFAVAQVPGYPNVPVYLNGQIAARTDKDGYAILPGLLSYQRNTIRIDTDNLPLEAQIEKTEADVVPHYHSGVSLKFSVELSTGALVKLVDEKGVPLPNGTVLKIEGNPEEFQVALQGEAYLTGLNKQNKMKATWYGQSCDIEVDLPENSGPLPHIGPIVCKGIQP